MVNITEISREPFSFSFTPSSTDANINGVTHGGVLYYLCDEMIGRYVTAMGRKGAAADANVHYYRPAPIGEEIIATVSERKIGKRLGTFLVELKKQ